MKAFWKMVNQLTDAIGPVKVRFLDAKYMGILVQHGLYCSLPLQIMGHSR